jgi:phosphatidylserine/phosphatidylglycerophosphate/cardiolipin synthase-like enzyme
VVDQLRKTDPWERFHGITYRLSEHNALDPGWLIQTPDRWGRSAADLPVYQPGCPGCLPDIDLPLCGSDADCAGGGVCRPAAMLNASPANAGKRVCFGHSDAMADRLYEVIAAARSRVDIATLQWIPDRRFLAALRNAITTLARRGERVIVRVMVGQYPPLETNARALLDELVRDLDEVKDSRLDLHVAAMRSCTGQPTCGTFSWPHAKIIAVDGRVAITGGHNLWTRDYLLDRPIHDLSIQVRGPAAADATSFLDGLWEFTCRRKGLSGEPIEVHSYDAGTRRFGRACAGTRILPRFERLARPGKIPILSVGRLGAGIATAYANQGDLARDLLLGAARRGIVIVQQDFGFTFAQPRPIWPESALERIADFLLRQKGDVHIVLTNPDATGKTGATYSTRVPLELTARRLRDVVRRRSQMPDGELDAMLCRRLHIAPLRFGPDATWPGNVPIGNHAKFWMIDDRVFHIGSDNFYPVDLQEHGFIVDSRVAAAELRRQYWEPLWRWSAPAAISGAGASRCVFTEPVTTRR